MGFGSKGGSGSSGGQANTTTINPEIPPTANQPALEQAAGGRLAAAMPWLMSPYRPMDYFSAVPTPQNMFPQMQPGMMASGQWGQQGQGMMPQAPGFGQYPPAPAGFGQNPMPNPWMMQQTAQQPPGWTGV